MTSTGNSMLYSFLLFVITLSLQQVYKDKLASTELYTVFGGLISSLLFLLVLTVGGSYYPCNVNSLFFYPDSVLHLNLGVSNLLWCTVRRQLTRVHGHPDRVGSW